MTLPQPRPGVMDIPLYEGGKSRIQGVSRVIKLSSNEAALGPSPLALAAFAERQSALHRYPASDSSELRAAIAAVHGLDQAQIICGAGSDEVLGLLCRAYAGPGDEVIHTAHGFLMYGIYAHGVGAKAVAVSESNLTADVSAILAAVTPRTKIVFLANPNNPTGTYLPKQAINGLRESLREDILLVLDAAYAEFMDAADYDDGTTLAKTTPNTVVTHTFSKIYGLATLRLGWGFGSKAIINTLERLRNPFNVSGPAQAAGIAAVRDQAHIAKAKAHNTKWMKIALQRLRGLGLTIVGDSGNFLLPLFDGKNGKTAAAADAFLQSRGVIARRIENYGLPNHLRMTIGADDEMELVLNTLSEFMGSSHG
ncbi:MAG: histidinol-phosphate transaminase [Rhodospirillaceae bacterium]|nr:histidinol-phosphate transaminase [Rhodospirillaceae bacterium]